MQYAPTSENLTRAWLSQRGYDARHHIADGSIVEFAMCWLLFVCLIYDHDLFAPHSHVCSVVARRLMQRATVHALE